MIPKASTRKNLAKACRLEPPNSYAMPWTYYWPGAHNAPTDG